MNERIKQIIEALGLVPDDALAVWAEVSARHKDAGQALAAFVAWGVEAAKTALGTALPDEAAVRAFLKGIALDLAAKRPGYKPDHWL